MELLNPDEEDIQNVYKNAKFISVKRLNHIIETTICQHRNTSISIKKINDNQYVYLPTGEIRDCKHIENRSQSVGQVKQSLKRLRDYINYNITDVNKCKWITLTYKDNMQDTKQLYNDFRKFIKRLKYKFSNYKIEYIVAMEPQGRGAWHCHLLLIFNTIVPFISNKIISDLWGHGFTKTAKLDDIDNIGAYLTAYLADIELNDTSLKNLVYDNNVSEISVKIVNSKKFIKGGRLYLYPPKFNLYRVSRGIKKPPVYLEYYSVFKNRIEKERLGKPSFTKAVKLFDKENNFTNTIIYNQYNTKRN